MGLSETILAAMIGAMATVTTALFQIFTAFRAKGKADVKPKRGTTMRSVLAVLALMVASAAGGFLYSELLKERNSEDLRAMRQELKELKELTASATRARDAAATPIAAQNDIVLPAAVSLPVGDESAGGSAESVVYVPACRRSGVMADAVRGCEEGDAQRIALCGTVPSYSRVHGVELFVQPDAVQHPWEQYRAVLEQDLGGARFTGRSFEYAQGQDLKAVCVNFMHWSSDRSHIARIVVEYGFGDKPDAGVAPVPAVDPFLTEAPSAVIAAEPVSVEAQTASFVGGTFVAEK
jgi:hypothetical protein